MTEAQTAKPVDTTPSVSIDSADEAPKPANVEARDTLTHEASVTQQAESTELSRSLSTITQPSDTASAGQFVVGMDSTSLTDHSVSFGDGSRVAYSNNLPQELIGPDGSVTKFQWEGGKLNGIQLPDCSKWQFQDGKWQHSDASGRTDASADGLPFENGARSGLVTGQITEATLKRLNNGYLAPPQLNLNQPAEHAADPRAIRPGVRADQQVVGPVDQPAVRPVDQPADQPAVTPSPTVDAPVSLSPETLTTAVESLRKGINDRHKVEAILRAIPAENKQQFEQLYRETTNRDLRRDLQLRRMDSAISLLDPREEGRQASWLQGNLSSLSRLPTNSTERALVEHNIRLNLRGMSDADRQSLSHELQQKTGKNLEQTLAGSALSAPSKEIATIYAKHGNNLSPEQLRQVADIALNSNVSGEQKLFMVKEAFSGDTESAKQARQQFMGTNGEGEARLRQVFGNNDRFKQARDYAQTGRLDTATFIDLQRSNVADNDKGIELVLHTMTPEQRQMFKQGQSLTLSGKTEGADAKETDALRYYQRVHDALGRAAERITSPSRWSESNRNRVVTNWEDIAAHGEQTLVGRLASAEGRVAVENAITNFTERDQALMSDPAYRKQVWDMLGGPPGTDDSTAYARTIFSGIETEAARERLAKVFPENLPPEASLAARHPTLAEASEGYLRFGRREPFVPRGQDHAFNALMHAKPEDYAALSREQRQMLNARVNLIPDGARQIARELLTRLEAGQDVQPGAPEQVILARLQNGSRQSIAEAILKQPAEVRQDPRMEQAARFAFGEDFDKYGKSVLEGRGISAEHLLDINTQRGFIWNSIDHNNYYNGLKLIPGEQREQILSAAEKAKSNDPEAKRYLDQTFGSLSAEQREVALNVLRNPNQEFSLADQIRAKSTGASIDQQRLIDGFARMTPQDRLGAINDYATRYNRFLVDDLSKNADENQRRQIDLSLPMSRGDLDRAFRDSVRDGGRGMYGHTAITEISIGEAQNRFQSQLIDRLPPEQRQQAQQDIDQAFQKYVQALRENSEAKDQYARDLSEKIMLAVTTVGAGFPIGTTLVRLALTTATAVAARGTSEHLIKGGLTSSDVTQAAILGTIDGATLGRATAFKSIFQKTVSGAIESHIGADATRSVLRTVDQGFQNYLRTGERGRLDFEAQLTDALRRRGVSNPHDTTRDIIATFRKESFNTRLQEAFAEFPDSKAVIEQLFQFGKKDALQSAVDRGLLTNDQMKTISSMVNRTVQGFAETPALREQALKDMKSMTDNLRFITEGATSPLQAQTYADVFVMAQRNKNVPIPLEALRNAEPQTLAFYRDQMTGVLNHFKAPGAVSAGGARYEFAMQHEIMDAISKSTNPEMRDWVFIPGAKGSTADHAGLDGALVNIKDGRIMPIDLKNYDIGNQIRWATHIPGRTPGLNFDNRALYDERTGRLVENARPRPEAVEAHLLGLTRNHSNWIIKPDTFAEMNPASNIRFPGLGDAPAADDVAGMRTQAARMREFIAQADNGGNSNTSLLRQRLQSPQNGHGGLRFVEQEVARLEASQTARAANEGLGRLRAIDPTVTEAEARKIFALRDQISSAHPERELPSDRTLIAAQRTFDRVGMKPVDADFAALLAAKTPAEIERVAADSVVRQMSGLLENLARSQKPDDTRLTAWSELFRNRQTGVIDRDMLREIARDPIESRQLQEILAQLYRGHAPAQRQEIVNRAIDRIATL